MGKQRQGGYKLYVAYAQLSKIGFTVIQTPYFEQLAMFMGLIALLMVMVTVVSFVVATGSTSV